MRSSKRKTGLATSPLSFLFVLTFTVSAAMTGLFGLYPNNPITQQYRTVVARNVSPEFLAPVNDFLGLLNLQPIPEDQYQPGDGWVLDPGGWLLEQFGMTVPPLYGPDSTVVVFDPAGVLLELLGVDVAALPESSGPLDPAGSIFQQIGLTLPTDSPNDKPPDPAGTLLAFLFPGYDPASVSDEPLLDPGGILLAWIIPGYQPPPINDSQNPLPDPAGQLLAWLGSPELINTSNNTLSPGDVILNWLFPPASEPQLPGEQDIIDAAMTSIVATQPNLASLATDTPTPTLTLMPTNALTFTPISTLTPTGTASSVVIINSPPVNNPAPAPTATYTPTPVTYTVSYNANGATSGTAPASQTKIQGVALTLATNSGGLALTGSIFNGWNTMPDGSGTHYAEGGAYTTDVALTLYAEWTVGCLNAITVSNANDSGTGSLRQAMIDLCPGGTITFAGNHVITLASQLPTVSNTMTITGNGATNTIIQAAASPNVATYIVFGVAASGNLTLNGVSVQNGVAPTYGGGIYNTGTLTVNNSTFSGNNGVVGAGICNFGGTLTVNNSVFSGNISSNTGGGIMSSGTMTVNNSTFSGNSASVVGGGISNQGTMTVTNSTFSGNSTYAGGGIALSAGSTATVTNSTFSGNSANYGGGLDSQGTLTVTNNTLSGNSASNIGGGIYNEAGGTLYLRNTILANSPTGGDCSNGATIVTNTNNLISDGSCSPALSGSPLLGPLASNGGPTQTFALLAGSPAIDAGDDSSCPSTDQRGSTRPQGLHCDIGAYESSFSAPTPAGHTISSFSLNGGGNAVTVTGGSSVTVDYNYQVWGDSSTCPGCNYQLVWGLENNWQYCSAWTSPSPGDYPGLSGTGSPFNITAPAPTGTYTIYSFSGQYADCTAAETAYTSAGGTAQGTITVP